MPTRNYRIKIIRGDLQFEAEGDKSFVLKMLDRFEGEHAKDSIKPDKPLKGKKSPGTRDSRLPKPTSIGEFIRQIGVKRHTDIVLAFGYYLEKYSGRKEFTPADINTCYYDSKMESSNTSQMIIRNIKQSRLMEAKKKAGEKKKRSYLLTRTGEEYIESRLNKEEQ